jgi:hypothetical protein
VRYEQRREQLQPRRLGRVSGDGSGCLSTAFTPSVAAASSVAATVANTPTTIPVSVSSIALPAAPTPTIHVPVGPAVVQRQLPAAHQRVRMPIWLVVEHASLRRQRAYA